MAGPEGVTQIGKTGSEIRRQPGLGCARVAGKVTVFALAAVGTVAMGTLEGFE